MELYYHDVDRDVLILSAEGGLSAATSERFVDEIESLIDAGIGNMVIDCSRLQRISSLGIGLLIRLHTRLAKHGGHVKLAAVPSRVVDVLRVMGLDSAFEIYRDVAAAGATFPSSEADSTETGT